MEYAATLRTSIHTEQVVWGLAHALERMLSERRPAESAQVLEGNGYKITLPECWSGAVSVTQNGAGEFAGYEVTATGWGIEGKEVLSCYPVYAKNVPYFVDGARRLGSATLADGTCALIHVWDDNHAFLDIPLASGNHLFVFAPQAYRGKEASGAWGIFVANALARLQTQGSLSYADDRHGYEIPLASLRTIARGIVGNC